MHEHLLLDDLFGLVDEALLEGLYLLLHLEHVGIGALEVAATVDIQRILEFLR
jgi:hypothetical protein